MSDAGVRDAFGDAWALPTFTAVCTVGVDCVCAEWEQPVRSRTDAAARAAALRMTAHVVCRSLKVGRLKFVCIFSCSALPCLRCLSPGSDGAPAALNHNRRSRRESTLRPARVCHGMPNCGLSGYVGLKVRTAMPNLLVPAAFLPLVSAP